MFHCVLIRVYVPAINILALIFVLCGKHLIDDDTSFDHQIDVSISSKNSAAILADHLASVEGICLLTKNLPNIDHCAVVFEKDEKLMSLAGRVTTVSFEIIAKLTTEKLQNNLQIDVKGVGKSTLVSSTRPFRFLGFIKLDEAKLIGSVEVDRLVSIVLWTIGIDRINRRIAVELEGALNNV